MRRDLHGLGIVAGERHAELPAAPVERRLDGGGVHGLNARTKRRPAGTRPTSLRPRVSRRRRCRATGFRSRLGSTNRQIGEPTRRRPNPGASATGCPGSAAPFRVGGRGADGDRRSGPYGPAKTTHQEVGSRSARPGQFEPPSRCQRMRQDFFPPDCACSTTAFVIRPISPESGSAWGGAGNAPSVQTSASGPMRDRKRTVANSHVADLGIGRGASVFALGPTSSDRDQAMSRRASPSRTGFCRSQSPRSNPIEVRCRQSHLFEAHIVCNAQKTWRSDRFCAFV